MNDLPINYVSIIVAAITGFVLSFLWYTVLFGKAWAKEMGIPMDPDKKPEFSGMAKGMAFQLIGLFLLAFVFAHNIAAWQFVPGMKELPLLSNVMNAAVFTWLGFYVPSELGKIAWEGKTWKLFAINAGYHLVALAVMSFIITKWIS